MEKHRKGCTVTAHAQRKALLLDIPLRKQRRTLSQGSFLQAAYWGEEGLGHQALGYCLRAEKTLAARERLSRGPEPKHCCHRCVDFRRPVVQVTMLQG